MQAILYPKMELRTTGNIKEERAMRRTDRQGKRERERLCVCACVPEQSPTKDRKSTCSDKISKGLGLDDTGVGGVEEGKGLLEFDFLAVRERHCDERERERGGWFDERDGKWELPDGDFCSLLNFFLVLSARCSGTHTMELVRPVTRAWKPV